MSAPAIILAAEGDAAVSARWGRIRMNAGKAVALLVAWFALTVVSVKAGITLGLSISLSLLFPPVWPIIGFERFLNSTSLFALYGSALLRNGIVFVLVVAAPIAVVAWKRERIYTLLGGDLTKIRRALVLLTAWIALAAVAMISSFAPHLFVAVVLQSIFDDLIGINNSYFHWLEILSQYLIIDVLTLILPLALVVWNRGLIYDLLHVDSWFGAKSE